CRMQAQVLAYLGINLNFAPVLDLATGLRNPAIGTRAFSDNPAEISLYGKIFVDAHRNLRVGTTAKHFPGHGRSETDSHHAAGEVRADKATLWAEDLLPFRELVAYGIPAVMLAHLTYPALDPENPAVFSRKIVTELLRGQMGFEGLVISDCVEMSAISQSDNPSRIIQRGLFAGIDLFISSFSLMKSLAFQLELKKALDEVQLAQAEDNGVNKATEYRLYGFLNEYPGQPAGEDALQVDVEKTAALHRRTIHMQRKAPLREAYRQFFLLELSNREQKGINADEHWGPVAKQLLDSQALIKQHQILFECDIPAVGKIINQANRDHLTVILLTNAGFAREGYIPFLKYLKNADSAIHVSLSDERDLTGTLDNEWVVWGFNSWTAMALSEELLVA
ncbi:MAG: glycoside hydrolase family 3 N-terminal domain-containing protein, partial [bacterium]